MGNTVATKRNERIEHTAEQHQQCAEAQRDNFGVMININTANFVVTARTQCNLFGINVGNINDKITAWAGSLQNVSL